VAPHRCTQHCLATLLRKENWRNRVPMPHGEVPQGGTLAWSSCGEQPLFQRNFCAFAGLEHAVRLGTPSALHSTVSLPPKRARKPLVLVAEDETEAAELIESILRREGCDVLIATDGAQALEMARELPRPDLIMLDLELPVMDGRACIAAMRADPSLSGIPVFIVSGAADATTVRATDNVRKARLLDGLGRVMARLRGEMPTHEAESPISTVEIAVS
jgi:CheY-like chemotaxis protein